MIKAITFDLDGVYFPNGKQNFLKALGVLGVSEDEAKRVFYKSPEMNELYKTGKMTDFEYWTYAANEWKLNKTPQELMDLLIDGYDIDEQVVETVKAVRKNGYETLICSSNFPARVNGLQKKFSFLNNFDVAVLSYEVGENKPSDKIFKTLIERSGVSPEEIVFADDHEPNVLYAQKFGITAFLYEGFDKFVSQLKSLGVEVS